MSKSKKKPAADVEADEKHAEIRRRLLDIRRNHPNEVADNKFLPHIGGGVISEAIWLSDQLLEATGETADEEELEEAAA